MSETSFASGVTANDLRSFLAFWPISLSEANETGQVIIENKATLLPEDIEQISWCHLYELPFEQHVSRFCAPLIHDKQVKFIFDQIAESPNPIGAVPEAAVPEAAEQITEHYDLLEKPDQKKTEETSPLLTSWLSVLNSFKCVLYHGCYLNELIDRVRANDDKALFAAVSIDPTVVGCKPVIERISKATLLKDNSFFIKLRAAINGKMGKREQANFQKMRLVLEILSEFGATRLTDEQLYELFVEELKLYTGNPAGGGSARALRKFADTYMKKNAST